MGLFDKLKTDGLEEAQDRLGGFQVFDSGAYDAVIRMAYAITSAGGAQGVVLSFDIDGRSYNETVYVTNRKGENFFLNQNDKTKKIGLPGFVVMDHICLATTEKPLSDQETEEKVVKVYDRDAGAEVPKSVPVLVELLNQPVTLGILNQLVNKNEKNGAGEYVPTEETRNENVIDKVFHTGTKLTMVEALAGATEPKFYEAWVSKNAGQVRDKTVKGSAAGNTGRAGAPTSGGSAPAGGKGKSLFGAKS